MHLLCWRGKVYTPEQLNELMSVSDYIVTTHMGSNFAVFRDVALLLQIYSPDQLNKLMSVSDYIVTTHMHSKTEPQWQP